VVGIKQKYYYYIVISTILIFYGVASAETKVSVTLDMDRSEATLVDTIKLVVKLEGKRTTPPPTISGLEFFHVRQGGTSSRFQVINGRINSGTDYIFYITPQKKGDFLIGPAEVVVKGKKYQSQALRLKVQDTPTETGEERGSLFLTATLSADTGYVGQKFIYALKFYRAKDVSDISLVLPEVEGLSFKKLGDHKEYISTWQGRNYSVIELRYALTSDTPGSHTITPTFFKMKVVDTHDRFGRGGFFDDSFFGMTRTKPISIVSNTTQLEVKHLPEAGRPPDFSGLVGNFSLSTSLSPQEVKVGESATLTVIISGKGNAHLIPDLKIPDLKDVKTYADQPTLDIQTTFEGVSGTKTMKWAIVPKKKGAFVIPSMSLSYFNTESERYSQTRNEPLTLHVKPHTDGSELSTQTQKIDIKEPIKRDVEMQGLDILSIHEGPDALRPDTIQKFSAWHRAALVFAPPFLFCLVLGLRQYLESKKAEGSISTQKKAASKFHKSIKSLKCPDQLADMMKITNLYLNERMDLSGGSLTSHEAYEILIQNGIDERLASEARDILSYLENHVYAGHGDTDRSAHIKATLATLIKRINKQLP